METNGGTKHAFDNRFIRGLSAILPLFVFWLLTYGLSPIGICKHYSCNACAGTRCSTRNRPRGTTDNSASKYRSSFASVFFLRILSSFMWKKIPSCLAPLLLAAPPCAAPLWPVRSMSGFWVRFFLTSKEQRCNVCSWSQNNKWTHPSSEKVSLFLKRPSVFRRIFGPIFGPIFGAEDRRWEVFHFSGPKIEDDGFFEDRGFCSKIGRVFQLRIRRTHTRSPSSFSFFGKRGIMYT